MNDHKSRITNHNETKKETLLINHFNYGDCKNKTYSVRILETIKTNARKRGKLDSGVTNLRRKREDFWMERLHTIYPYGLNNRHGKNLDQTDINEPIRKKFIRRKVKKNRRNYRKYRNKQNMTADLIFHDISNNYLRENNRTAELLNKSISFVSNKVSQLNKIEVEKLNKLAFEELNADSRIPLRLLQIIIDMTKWKMFKPSKIGPKRKKNIKFPFIIRYTNHWVDKLKLPKIMHSEELKNTLPKCIYE